MPPRAQPPAYGGAASAGISNAPVDHPPTVSWLRILGAVAGRMVVMLVVIMGAWACVPSVLGWKTTTVVTGSMEPAIAVGDVVAAVPVGSQDLTPGRVVLVDDPDHAGRLRLHRIAAVNPDGSLILRGDANAANDSSSVWPAVVHGIGYLRIPVSGLPVVWIGNGQWLKLAALAGTLASALALTRLDRPLTRGSRRTGTTTGNRPERGPRHITVGKRRFLPAGRPASVLLITSVAAAMAAAAMLAAPAAYAAFSGSKANPENTFAARPYFSCTAAIIADSPTLFFAFNDTTAQTRVTDSSGNGMNGTFQTTSSLSSAVPCSGDTGKSAQLAGTRYISTAGTAKTAPTVFSYELWFRTSSTLGGKLAGFESAQTGTSAAGDRNLYMRTDGRLVFGVAPGGTIHTVVSPSAYNDGKWHHTAVTLSAAGMQLYVDGVSVSSTTGISTARSGSGWWRFGNGALTGWPGAGGTAFNAEVDNIAVYNTTALTPDRVLAHFQACAP